MLQPQSIVTVPIMKKEKGGQYSYNMDIVKKQVVIMNIKIETTRAIWKSSNLNTE